MSEQFKPGQTVWFKNNGRQAEIVAISTLFTACLRHPDGSLSVVDFCEFAATDPFEPKPQKCPFCGKEGCCRKLFTTIELFRCECSVLGGDCDFMGPMRKNPLEAIQVWNSIQVGKGNSPTQK